MIEIDGLRFQYARNSEELFGGLSHRFEMGVVTALAGASGRGKSTLLYMLGLMLKPSAGSIRIDGQDTVSLRDSERSALRAEKLGFVFQDSSLDPSRTILDSVLEPALYAGTPRNSVVSRARDLLGQFGVGHRADQRPGQISGGQAQRVALCRALINNPGVILADEPTGNLDRDNAMAVMGTFRDAASTSTVIIASHDPFVLDQVDHVVSL